MLLDGYLPPSQRSVRFAEQQLLRQQPAAQLIQFQQKLVNKHDPNSSGNVERYDELKEVIDEPLVTRGIILAIVAVLITVVVYGAVALIVKMDDVGLRMAQSDSDGSQRTGRSLVAAMPKVRMVAGVAVTMRPTATPEPTGAMTNSQQWPKMRPVS